jgi:hypothetical protein
VTFAGRIQLSELAFARAQHAPLLEMFVFDDDGNCSTRVYTAAELLTDNRYDAASNCWLFSCSLHDDDWDNANNAFTKTLPAIKDLSGTDFVFAFRNWNTTIDRAWRVDRGECTPFEPAWCLPRELATQILDGAIDAAEPAIRAELAAWGARA